VKLAKKERVGSRLRRRYQAPQTPLQRLAASGAADPARMAELQRLREGLDPFDLSATIEPKLQGIFAPPTALGSAPTHRVGCRGCAKGLSRQLPMALHCDFCGDRAG